MAQLPFAVIPHPLGTVATGNEAAGFDADHMGEFLDIGMTWKSSGASNVWIRGDFGVAKPIDFVSILSANALAGTTIRVRLGDSQAEVDGTADYDSGAVAFISPSITSYDGLYHSHLELPSVQTKRWWRVDIGGHTGDFQASMLVMGQKVAPTRYYMPGWEYGVEDLGNLSVGRWGVAEIEDGLTFRTLRFKLGWIDEAEFEAKFRPLSRALGKRNVAFWCFDPTANAYRQAKSYFGWLKEAPYAVGGEAKPGTLTQEYVILSMI